MIRDFIRRAVAPHIELERTCRLRAEDAIYRTMESHRKHELEEIDLLASELAQLRKMVWAHGVKSGKVTRKK